AVILNEPGCSAGSCHAGDAGQRVRGVLDIEMSMFPLEAALADARTQLLVTTGMLFVVIALVAAFVFRRFIRQPIAQLQDGARRIAGGDLSTRIDVKGRHELAHLAADFNHMAEDLSRAQREVEEWSETLEEKVEQRTEELKKAQHQVMHMEKMASLGKLSATVAHELNNPLAGILTYARLVERELGEQAMNDDVRGELGRYLGVVQQESARCGAIVKNLLLFARPEGGEMTLFDLNEVLDRSFMLVRHHMEMSGVTLQAERLEADPMIFGQAAEIQQALVALFVNAVEAMKKGGELHVRIWDDPVQVAIDIEDTGTGIAAEALPHIFEPVFSTKEKESGVGLGLAVVYGIIHRHKGIIGVESEIGRGTMFHIVLPRDSRPRAPVVEACPWAPGMVGRSA
ncbi:MAG: HAMP domain-containing protein, partial [Gemmatimonadetes bacterium]|nr:HAMP domain-containing protein [Gemmatimonadota bacterium]